VCNLAIILFREAKTPILNLEPCPFLIIQAVLVCDQHETAIAGSHSLTLMPHSTIEPSSLRTDSSAILKSYKLPQDMRTSLEKFPDHVDTFPFPGATDARTPTPKSNGSLARLPLTQDRSTMWSASRNTRADGRQKSLSDALKTIRTRRGSVSQNAQEIADALKAPVSPRLIVWESIC
jgi:hypothetical protein